MVLQTGTLCLFLLLIISGVLAVQILPGETATATSGAATATSATVNADAAGNATAEFVSSLQNQSVDPSFLPSINLTVQENVSKAGILNYDGSQIPIIYKPVGNRTDTEVAGVLEGDIILGKEIIGGKAAVDRFITTSKWPNGIIPVFLHPNVPNRDDILDAMIYIMRNTNNQIVFKPVQIENGRIVDEHYVMFVPSPQLCSSALGMQPQGRQYVAVAPWCKMQPLTHELGHTIGLWHEQSRCDRDEYIDIIESNIKPDWLSQFNAICDPTRPERSPISFGEYDYCSIMHYPLFGSQSPMNPSKPIMAPLKQVKGCTLDDIGKYKGLSPIDKEAIDDLY